MKATINIPDTCLDSSGMAKGLEQIADKMDLSTIIAIGQYCEKQTDKASFNKKLKAKLQLGGIIK